MSFNRYMHPENKYKVAPDFKKLALKYPEFLKHLTQDIRGRMQLDFKNPESLRMLSQTLLKADFGLNVDIPSGSLVPTIPSRLNYLLWIKDLVKLVCGPSYQTIKGIDIGTGSSSVYCLLAAKQFGWSMLGTEVDDGNYKTALKNILQNNLEKSISLTKVTTNQILEVPGLQENDENSNFTFSMCNPPFFTPDAEGEQPGKDCEVKTQGGEVKFVQQMADQSKVLKERVKIFTTLLGHKSSLLPIKHYLKQLGVTTVTTTEFCQGRCMRWGVAWSFQNITDLKELRSTKTKKDMEKPFSWTIPCEQGTSLNLFQTLKLWFTQIKVDLAVKKESKHFCSARLTTHHALWRNQRKQRREKQRLSGQGSPEAAVGPSDLGGKYSEQMEADGAKNSIDMNGTESCLLAEQLYQDSTSCLNSTESERSVMKNGNESVEMANNGDCTQDSPEIKEEESLKLECNLTIRLCGPLVKVELVYLEGEAGRDGVHQLIQFLKNKHSKK